MANLPEHLDPASQHQAVLQQAFNSLGNNLQGHAVTIVVEEGSKICVNSDFLIFHSPFFRSLLCSSSNSEAVHVFLPDTSATAVLALEGLLSKGVTRCKSKADEVEALARLLGIHQIKVNCGEGAVVPPRTILPADVFQEVTERIVLKTEPAETLQEESEGSTSTPSQVSTNLLVARPPRPRPPPQTFQGVKRKDSPVRPVKESEKNRREELLKKALIGSTLDNLVSSPRLATVSRNKSGRTVPCTVQSQPSPSGVTSPIGISAHSNLNNHKAASPMVKPPLAPKPPLPNFPQQQTTSKPAVTSALRASLDPKQIETLLSSPSIGSSTQGCAVEQGKAGSSVPFKANAPLPLQNVSNSPLDSSIKKPSSTSSTPKRPGGNVESPRCNFSLECEVCKVQAKTLSMLYTHCASHFHKRVEEKHTDLMHGLKCLLCGFMFKSKYLLTNHIACKHGKINDILTENGYKVLPCPINGVKQDEIQRNMISIKKERMEGDVTWMEGQAKDESLPQTPPGTQEQNYHAQALNEILAKYNNKSSNK